MELNEKWSKHAESVLLNRKIIEVRYLTDEEMENMSWSKRPIGFLLDDQTFCFISCDDEGNDGGVMFYSNDKEQNGVIPVI